jgi:hypothetical protein
VRSVPLILLISAIVLPGCAMPEAMVRRATRVSPVIRAQSNGLAELEAQAHSPRREEPSKRTERTSAGTCCRTCNHSPCTCSSSSGNSLVAQTGLMVLGSPFMIPSLLIGDNHDHFTEFPDYPYADGVPGSILIDSEFKGTTQSVKGTVQTFAIPGSSDLDRFGGRLLLENADRIGIDTETDYWLQTHRHGGPDHAWNGDFNVVYRFAESRTMEWRAGVGFNWLVDQTDPAFGVNFTYGIDWYPRKPWTVSSVIDWGMIGNSTLFHNRTTAGVMVGRTELYAGYDYFQLGTANFHGPVAGIGYRF